MPGITRDQFLSYLNTTPAATATYSLIGEGFTSLTENLNPNTVSRTFIHEKSTSKDVVGYDPVYDFTAEKYTGDAVIDYICDIAEGRLTGADCITDIVNVHMDQAGVTQGTFVAYKQEVSIRVDHVNGGQAPSIQPVTGSFLYRGEPIEGEFNPTTKAFTAV